MTELYFARWVLPMASPPIEDGGVAAAGSHVIGTGTRDELVAQFPGAAARYFGEAALLPGFVNAHSHLAREVDVDAAGTHDAGRPLRLGRVGGRRGGARGRDLPRGRERRSGFKH